MRTNQDDYIDGFIDSKTKSRPYPVVDHRTPDEIIGYDENGLPYVTGVVVDSSAVVAISLREPGHEWLTEPATGSLLTG